MVTGLNEKACKVAAEMIGSLARLPFSHLSKVT